MLLAGKGGGSLCCWSLNLEELLPPFLRDPQSRRKMNKKLWRRNRMRTEKWKAEFKIKEPSVQKCAEKTNQKQKKRHKAAALETTRPLPLNNWSLSPWGNLACAPRRPFYGWISKSQAPPLRGTTEQVFLSSGKLCPLPICPLWIVDVI